MPDELTHALARLLRDALDQLALGDSGQNAPQCLEYRSPGQGGVLSQGHASSVSSNRLT